MGQFTKTGNKGIHLNMNKSKKLLSKYTKSIRMEIIIGSAFSTLLLETDVKIEMESVGILKILILKTNWN
jgi:hypothetical protein